MNVLNGIKNANKCYRSLDALTRVWDACSNMKCYIQYGFITKERNKLFGKKNLNRFILTDFDHLVELLDIDIAVYADFPGIIATVKNCPFKINNLFFIIND